MPRYYGEYVAFQTASKKDGGYLIGADNFVGDIYDLDVELEDGQHKAWLVNRFGKRIGFLDSEDSRQVSLLKADGLICKGVLSFVAFTNDSGEGRYWGQVALICYSPTYSKEFGRFIEGVSDKIAHDIRPKIDIGPDVFAKVVESDGQWLPSQNMALPDTSKDMTILKQRRGLKDSLIEQGRAGNKGCYVASWVFLLAVVALIVFALKSCFGW